ncbi:MULTISPECIES: oxidoreductase [unclassified Curtobacterium]|uniref:oxidoreductase n=1 Tax=unclassified Curtobacterium TaxID=257496 RepID=UPI0008DE082B|nr:MULTISPECIES: oxidoreductase [unclassified Curtobacterium]OIH98348.1 2-dehydropantoate 2-reductase [Curtobacterium sp. MCBA15_003]OII14172.1 2-dehydropantoate 2-reductase [Curtobacterium sp. MCBA15_009]OII32569.1 2-dehydropantoate 2-reductase [Curtobacterium sp. MMLR14_006]
MDETAPQTVEAAVAVVGPGAIGATVAAVLHEAGRTPFLAGRTARAELVVDLGGTEVTVPGPVHTDPVAPTPTADVVFLAVKATQNRAAAPWLAALCGPDTVVCVLQNGIEQVSTVAPLVPRGRVVPAVVWFPARTRPDGSVELRATPRLTLPRGTAGVDTVQAALAGTRCTVEAADDFRTLAWRKLLQNAAAGLMVLTGRRSGMYARDDVGALTLAYLAEAAAVARADGAVLDDDEPGRILQGFRDSPADAGTSILTDREAGRPLEWSVRNDVLRRRARRYGLPTPIGDVVVPLLAAASDGPG